MAVRQIARYEAGEQQPALNVAQKIANALDITLDEPAGSYSDGLGLSGDWYMSWQTWKDGVEYYTVQRVHAAQKNDRLVLVAERGDANSKTATTPGAANCACGTTTLSWAGTRPAMAPHAPRER